MRQPNPKSTGGWEKDVEKWFDEHPWIWLILLGLAVVALALPRVLAWYGRHRFLVWSLSLLLAALVILVWVKWRRAIQKARTFKRRDLLKILPWFRQPESDLMAEWPLIRNGLKLPESVMFRKTRVEGGTTYFLKLNHLAAQTVKDLVAVADDLPGALRLHKDARVDISPGDHGHLCSFTILTKDPLSRTTSYPGASSQTITDPLRIGIYGDRAPMALRFDAHTLVAGVTGGGKSMTLNVLTAEITSRRDALLWVADPSKEDLEYGIWAPCLGRLATNMDDTRTLLTDALTVIQARIRDMAAKREKDFRPSPERPLLILLIDEWGELVTQDKGVAALIDRIATKGRQLGVFLLLATQRPSADLLGTLTARAQITIRVAMNCDGRTGNMILGDGLVQEGWRTQALPLKGGMYLRSPAPEHSAPRRGRGYYLDADQIEALVEANCHNRPTLEPSVLEAIAESTASPEAGDSAGLPSELGELLELLRSEGDGLRLTPLAAELGVSVVTAKKRLDLLQARGLVVRDGLRWCVA